jgi:hypothetical protein
MGTFFEFKIFTNEKPDPNHPLFNLLPCCIRPDF